MLEMFEVIPIFQNWKDFQTFVQILWKQTSGVQAYEISYDFIVMGNYKCWTCFLSYEICDESNK